MLKVFIVVVLLNGQVGLAEQMPTLANCTAQKKLALSECSFDKRCLNRIRLIKCVSAETAPEIGSIDHAALKQPKFVDTIPAKDRPL